jgi:hypothetical protein
MLLTRFDSPGGLRDAPAGSPFYDAWHLKIDGMMGPGGPGSGGVGEFYNATRKDVDVVAVRQLLWMGFPRRLLVARHRDDRREAYRLADEFTLSTRDRQEEYLEWRAVEKAGKIVKVTFTTEVREYWEELFRHEPDTVVQLYRNLVGDNGITRADLQHPSGEYNLRNDWNTTKGILHLIVDNLQNSLAAAVGLAVKCVDLRNGGGPHFRDNYELQEAVRQDEPSADPRVNMDGNTLARRGLSVTLREPIGLYMAGWNDTGWTKPNGSPVGNYWRIVRGQPGMALRLEYEVPASEGFVVGDIRIGGRPIEFGGQMAEHITVMIAGAAGTPRP